MKNSKPRHSPGNESEQTKKYFAKYASKVSRMSAWKIEEELARKLVDYDELEESEGENRSQLTDKIMREIEILQARKNEKGQETDRVEFQVAREQGAVADRDGKEISQMKKWLLNASNWDLASEIDKYKSGLDSCSRKMGLMDFDEKGDYQKFQTLSSEIDVKKKMILVLKDEMRKRGIRP
jgi:hypothetical protein